VNTGFKKSVFYQMFKAWIWGLSPTHHLTVCTVVLKRLLYVNTYLITP